MAASTTMDAAKLISLAGTDGDGDTLNYTVASSPSNGRLSGTTHTPDAGYTGSDSFVYTINDGIEDSDPETVTITVSTGDGGGGGCNRGAATGEPSSLSSCCSVLSLLFESEGDVSF